MDEILRRHGDAPDNSDGPDALNQLPATTQTESQAHGQEENDGTHRNKDDMAPTKGRGIGGISPPFFVTIVPVLNLLPEIVNVFTSAEGIDSSRRWAVAEFGYLHMRFNDDAKSVLVAIWGVGRIPMNAKFAIDYHVQLSSSDPASDLEPLHAILIDEGVVTDTRHTVQANVFPLSAVLGPEIERDRLCTCRHMH